MRTALGLLGVVGPATFAAPPGKALSGLAINVNDAIRMRDEDIERVRALGANAVRFDLPWAQIERRAGEFDFSAYDSLLLRLQAAGLRAYLILDYGNLLYTPTIKTGPADPAQRAAFCRFVEASARHYGGRGFIWEVWNEPDADHFWEPRANAADYVELARRAASILRREAPGDPIVLPAAAGFNWPFLEACFRAGLLDLADGVSVHPYRPGPPETVAKDWAKLRALVKRFHPHRHIELICGEWGYSDATTPGLGLASAPGVGQAILARPNPFKMRGYRMKPGLEGGFPDPLGGHQAVRLGTADKLDEPGRATSGLIADGLLRGGRYYTVSAYFRTAGPPLELRFGLADDHVETIEIDKTWRRVSLTIFARHTVDRMFQVYERAPNNPAWFMAFPQVEETDSEAAEQAAEAEHASRMIRILETNLKSGVQFTVLYALKDLGSNRYEPSHHLGLLDSRGDPKESYRRLQQWMMARAKRG